MRRSFSDTFKNLGPVDDSIEAKLDTLISLNRLLVDAQEKELVDHKYNSGLQTLPNAVTTVPSDSNVNPATGYTIVEVYTILGRTAPELYFLNEGPGTIFIRMSKIGNDTGFFTDEKVVFEGEYTVLYDVWQLRIRTTTAGTQYRVTEFEQSLTRDRRFLKGRPYVSETTVAIAGIPNTENIVTDPVQGLGRNAHTGFIVCDGPGNLRVRLSDNGINFAPQITVIPNQILDLEREDVHTVTIDTTVGGTAYRLAIH